MTIAVLRRGKVRRASGASGAQEARGEEIVRTSLVRAVFFLGNISHAFTLVCNFSNFLLC